LATAKHWSVIVSETKIDLVIISGVTGAIGSALLAEYARRQTTVIYGISRKALAFEEFVGDNGKLPQKTLIFSIPGLRVGYDLVAEKIDFTRVRSITYIHALGLYPFEVDSAGNIVVADDCDSDGINDNVTNLTFNAFVAATQAIKQRFSDKLSCVIFAGLSDKHKPSAHAS
jgi:NAD(P)-dependent dehydrogenase (short-subunit alcohol dehydrogenase family)